MSEHEENSLIVGALRKRAEAKQKLKLVTDRLHGLGYQLRMLADRISPPDGSTPNWDLVRQNLEVNPPDRNSADLLDVAKLMSLLEERADLARIVEQTTDRLHDYGVE